MRKNSTAAHTEDDGERRRNSTAAHREDQERGKKEEYMEEQHNGE